jgi:hypothetical protein
VLGSYGLAGVWRRLLVILQIHMFVLRLPSGSSVWAADAVSGEGRAYASLVGGLRLGDLDRLGLRPLGGCGRSFEASLFF